ncbi:hypothetical protein FDENT_6821 [Fusarium denticulatum]|uniref:Uncharacterized protein n=1 Tax=Fusarium denticulatum TaxID=48507 RepID=A0A8H5UAB0_9HYPO|nr:hypothetical protein FDENT_6821 [Fusarium denticulatum]
MTLSTLQSLPLEKTMRFVNKLDQTQLINSEHEKRLPHACNSNLIDPGFIKRGPSQFDDPSQSLTAISDRGLASQHLDAGERKVGVGPP